MTDNQAISFDMTAIKFNADGLVPAIAQCAETGDVLMMAWMNQDAITQTLNTGRVTYYSRSRQELWEKGLTSGHTQELISAHLDCDGDTILLKINQTGAACHTGERTCFFTPMTKDDRGNYGETTQTQRQFWPIIPQ